MVDLYVERKGTIDRSSPLGKDSLRLKPWRNRHGGDGERRAVTRTKVMARNRE